MPLRMGVDLLKDDSTTTWSYRGGGGVRTGNFLHEKISHRVYFAQWPENPARNFAPFQDCTVFCWAVPALHCQIPVGSRIVLRISRSFQDCILYFQGVPA